MKLTLLASLNLSAQVQIQQPSVLAPFRAYFNANAASLDHVNAYILCYLNTMIYPQYLGPMLTPQVHEPSIGQSPSDGYYKLASKNEYFETKFIEHVKPKFTSIKADNSISFDFVYKCNQNGYDPEAMVISTPNTVFVIFRGTDRVGCASQNETGVSSDGYLRINWDGWQWNEWVKSDFEGAARPVTADGKKYFSGKVYISFWNSLVSEGYLNTLCDKVKAQMTGNKKLWIAGHSLGGGQAQIVALYLARKYMVRTQGLYLFSSAHAGDAQFVNELEAAIGPKNIQRFVFKTDPVTTMPPMPFYARAGEKNYFCDINFMEEDAEDVETILPWDLCYHHPTWILKGLQNKLSFIMRDNMPKDFPFPAEVGCQQLQKNSATKDDACRVLSNASNAVEDFLEDVKWAIGNVTDNTLGKSIDAGNYRFINYLHSKKTKKYLTRKTCTTDPLKHYEITCDHNQLFLDKRRSGNKQIFKIKHDGANYVICNPDNENSVLEIDAAQINTNGAKTDMGSKSLIDAVGNEHWWFFKYISPSGKKYYLIRSQSLPGKMLDAADGCNGSGGNCTVNIWSASEGNKSQIWILEKVN